MRRVLFAMAVVCAGGCAAEPSPPPVVTAPTSPESRAFSSACALRLPADLAEHASVPDVPRPVFERALAPVLLAACACVHPGDEVALVARMLPNEGEVRAAAPDDARVDVCVRSRFDPGTFEPIAFEESSVSAAEASLPARTSKVHTPSPAIVRPGRPHVPITVTMVLERP